MAVADACHLVTPCCRCLSVAAISDDELTVRIEAEEGSTTEESASGRASSLASMFIGNTLTRIPFPNIAVVLLLRVKYTPAYPDELPELDIEVQEGSEGSEEDRITEEDKQTLLDRLRETVRQMGRFPGLMVPNRPG